MIIKPSNIVDRSLFHFIPVVTDFPDFTIPISTDLYWKKQIPSCAQKTRALYFQQKIASFGFIDHRGVKLYKRCSFLLLFTSNANVRQLHS